MEIFQAEKILEITPTDTHLTPELLAALARYLQVTDSLISHDCFIPFFKHLHKDIKIIHHKTRRHWLVKRFPERITGPVCSYNSTLVALSFFDLEFPCVIVQFLFSHIKFSAGP